MQKRASRKSTSDPPLEGSDKDKGKKVLIDPELVRFCLDFRDMTGGTLQSAVNHLVEIGILVTGALNDIAGPAGLIAFLSAVKKGDADVLEILEKLSAISRAMESGTFPQSSGFSVGDASLSAPPGLPTSKTGEKLLSSSQPTSVGVAYYDPLPDIEEETKPKEEPKTRSAKTQKPSANGSSSKSMFDDFQSL